MTIGEAWSPLEIEVKMREVVERLEEYVVEAKALAIKAGQASHAYRKAQAQAFARSKADPTLKTDKVKEAWVLGETEGLMLERNMAEAEYEALKLAIRSLQTQADLLRSLGRSSRDLVESWGDRS